MALSYHPMLLHLLLVGVVRHVEPTETVPGARDRTRSTRPYQEHEPFAGSIVALYRTNPPVSHFRRRKNSTFFYHQNNPIHCQVSVTSVRARISEQP